MAYEVFDDVAFYFLTQSLLFLVLVPPTCIFICHRVFPEEKSSRKVEQGSLVSISDFDGLARSKDIDIKESFASKYFKGKYLLFGGLWVLFIYGILMMPAMQGQELASFKPYDILGLDPLDEPTDAQIKKAYKTLALKWHPDKNRDNEEEAERMFILVSKAHQTLQDPVAKMNMEKYGNPDGYKGVSVTIGLPSWLTRKENELRILLLYFLIFIVLPPIGVFLWWRKASATHQTGVLRETVAIYWKFLTEHMSTKFLVEVLAASAEYKVLQERPANTEAVKKLYVEVKDHMQKQKFAHVEYIARGNILLHAYLMRVPIPECLHEDLKIVLKDAHRLACTMFDVALSRKMIKPALGAIELMQLLSQALWVGDSSLKQLPHLTNQDINMARKKRVTSLAQFRELSQEQKEKLMKSVTPEQWGTIEKVAENLPVVEGAVKYEVEDEEGIYENDLIMITVTLTRKRPVELVISKKEEEVKGEGSGEVVKSGEESEEDEESEEGEEKDAVLAATDRRERTLLETLPVARKRPKPSKFKKSYEMFSPFFPFPKREKWFLILMAVDPKNKLYRAPLAVQKIQTFQETEVVELMIRAGQKGIAHYELNAWCDSYVGCDVQVAFKISVAKMTQSVVDARSKDLVESKTNGLDDNEDYALEEEEEYIGYWYLAGYSSFGELVLNVIVLCLLALFVVNFLQQRGYWQKYCEPIIARLLKVLAPVLDKVGPVITPVFGPVASVLGVAWTWFSDLIVVEDPAVIAEQLRRAKGEL